MRIKSVASILGIFVKLVTKLEKIQEQHRVKISKDRTIILDANERIASSSLEIDAADKAIVKMKEFLPDDLL